MDILVLASLAAEVMVMALGIGLAVRKKRMIGWAVALTFAIYVFYDSVRFFAIRVNEGVIAVLFFIASMSILWAVWRIYEGS